MQEIASYKRRVFLKDHPVVTQRIVLSSAGAAQTLLAGTVIASELIWDDGVSAADQQAALTELRKVGVFAGDA